ncbi:hypothetical protein M1B72_02230 [Geomonas paludis]|uniref:Uncharacterized protein n=1 Tax=Geomonas paludis TaxID=2740185 RepID=A0ABY4LEX2_9BACT|nr:hypothetical protein [Geomonas paludis]UPU36541.1 hypothetical protein M1B72_02230 [Geomonas paludis]
MNDKTTLMISWILLTMLIPTFLWNMTAGMAVGFIVAIIRWDELRFAEKAIINSKEFYWIGALVWWVVLAIIYLILKTSGSLSTEAIDQQGKVLMLLMSLPFLPKIVRHEYRLFVSIRNDWNNRTRY